MLPVKGCNPEINILYIGARILKKIDENKNKRIPIKILYETITKELSVSVDHVILSLDWLYVVSAISYQGKEVFINEID